MLSFGSQVYAETVNNVGAVPVRVVTTFQESGYITALIGRGDTAQNILVSLGYVGENDITTAPGLIRTIMGLSSFPVYLKRPLLVAKNQSIWCELQTLAGNTNCTVAYLFRPRPGLSPERTVRTRLHVLTFQNIANGATVFGTINFARAGHIHAINAMRWNALVFCRMQIELDEWRINQGMYGKQLVVGGTTKNAWVRPPIEVQANSRLRVTYQNLSGGVVNESIVFQFVPKWETN